MTLFIWDQVGIVQNLQTSLILQTNFLVGTFLPLLSTYSFKKNKTENTFSLQSVSQVLQYTNFPINRVHKFPKVEDTQLVQCPSHLSCPMSKFPKLSKPKLLKAQVTQSPSHPKLKLPNVQVAQIAKNINGPLMAKNIHDPPMARNTKS